MNSPRTTPAAPSSRTTKHLEVSQRVCAGVVGLTAAVVLVVGWGFGVDIVTRLHADLVSMKANTALGFLLLALLAGFAGRPRFRNVVLASSVAMLLLGTATIVEYGFDVDLGIDELLFDDTNLVRTGSPGRMGLNTAIGFALLGAAGLATLVRHHAAQVLARVAVAGTAALAFLALTGYIYGATSTRRLGSATEMAVHTSVLFLVGCAALLTPLSRRGLLLVLHSDYAGGQALRHLVPLLVFAVVATTTTTQLLRTSNMIEEQELELAFQTTAVLALVLTGFFYTAARLDRTDRAAAQSSQLAMQAGRELEDLLRVFEDRQYRTDAVGTVLTQHGDSIARGVRLDERYPKLDMNRLLTAARAAAPRPATVTFPHEDDGGPVTLEARAALVREDQLAVSVRDVTELVRTRDALAELNAKLEQRVAERTAELERSNAELAQFAHIASHDLKEPLRMVSSFVRKISDKYDDQLDERGRQYIAFASEGASRMEELIDSLLRFSRVGRASLSIESVDLNSLLRDVTTTLRPRIEEAHATVDVGELPTVPGNPSLLGQVFLNLTSNALKFVPDGTAPMVRITSSVDGEIAEIVVEDNGIGIAPEFRESVFSVFKRLHSRAAYEGTGIGLAIARRVVERHSGTIRVEDSALGGAKFVICLPMRSPEDDGNGD